MTTKFFKLLVIYALILSAFSSAALAFHDPCNPCPPEDPQHCE